MKDLVDRCDACEGVQGRKEAEIEGRVQRSTVVNPEQAQSEWTPAAHWRLQPLK